MHAGNLNRQIIVQKRTDTRQPGGGRVPTWADFVKVWADILTPTGKQQGLSNQQLNIVTTSFRVRFRSDIDASMRIIYDGEVFDIQAVLKDRAGRVYMDLLCTSGASEG